MKGIEAAVPLDRRLKRLGRKSACQPFGPGASLLAQFLRKNPEDRVCLHGSLDFYLRLAQFHRPPGATPSGGRSICHPRSFGASMRPACGALTPIPFRRPSEFSSAPSRIRLGDNRVSAVTVFSENLAFFMIWRRISAFILYSETSAVKTSPHRRSDFFSFDVNLTWGRHFSETLARLAGRPYRLRAAGGSVSLSDSSPTSSWERRSPGGLEYRVILRYKTQRVLDPQSVRSFLRLAIW